MTGHGCFNKYLEWIKKAPNALCSHCGDQLDEDDAAHTLLRCTAWDQQREKLKSAIGQVETGSLVAMMLAEKKHWVAVQEFAEEVMAQKEEAERERQRVQS